MATNKPEAAIIAAMIKEAREAKGWTRYELARRASVGDTHLRQIEEGAYCVQVDILNRLAKALEINVVFPLDR